MSDGNGSGTGNPGAGGEPSGAPAAGGQPGGEPSGAPSTGGQPAAGGQPTPSGGESGAGNWHEKLSEDLRGLAQTKGWLGEDPVSALESTLSSYRQLERHMGVSPDRLVRLPGEGAEATEWAEVFRKLGAPEKADGYDLTAPEGVDAESFGTMREWFAKAGLTPQQARAITEEYGQWLQSKRESLQTDAQAKQQELWGQLKQDYGEAFDHKMQLARKAAQAFDVDQALSSKLEEVMGSPELVKFFVGLGEKMGEASFRDGGPGGGPSGFGATLSPGEAKAEYDKLMTDENFRKQLMDPRHPGHQAALDRRSRLYKAMFPDQQ